MNKNALQLSLDSGLMNLLGKAQKDQERKIKKLEYRIAEQNRELAVLRPLKKKVQEKEDLVALRKRYESHGKAIMKEAARTLAQVRILQERKLKNVMAQPFYGQPKELTAAKKALRKVLDK